MSMVEVLLAELEQEAQATRRLLRRVATHDLEWSPHPKARSLGQLAMHIATTPKRVAEMIRHGSATADLPTEEVPESAEQIVVAFEESLVAARVLLAALSDAELSSERTLTLVRRTMLNHVYHHRGQLSMYLRTLGLPLPPIYGPTADE